MFTPNHKLISLDVIVESVLFQNEQDTFAIIRATPIERKAPAGELDFNSAPQKPIAATSTNKTRKTAKAKEPEKMAAKGNIGKVSAGETLRLHGRWVEHPVHGSQFQVELAVPILPENEQGVIRFLGSGLVPGLGPALATRIVDKFGSQTMHVITKQSAKLFEVKGIGKSKARQIGEAVRNKRLEAETLAYLYSLGIGLAHSKQVLKSYGEKTVSVIRENPYLLAEQIQGIGFKTADQIGKASGIDDNDPKRASGAVLHLLGKAADSGHTFLSKQGLLAEVTHMGIAEEPFETALDLLTRKKLIIGEEGNFFPPPLFEAETEVAHLLLHFHQSNFPKKTSEQTKKQLEQSSLSEEQKQAVLSSLEHGLMILTGGPGTGKTTTVRYIVEAHKNLKKKIVLCAPTGKAAKRLSEATGQEAKTIHRLLGWNPATGHFNHHETNPIDADTILVDEASMLDIRLTATLLKAVPKKASVIFVGDVDQLPPVSAGPVFREILKTPIGYQVRLTEIFRQAQNSPIVQGAYQVLHGEIPSSSPPTNQNAKHSTDQHATDRETGHLFVIEGQDPDQLQAKLSKIIHRIPAAYGLDPKMDVQVLTPTHRGPLGTEELNALLQNQLNPQPNALQTPQKKQFFPGDKVIQTKNNYDKEVFNGDMGIVTHMNKEKAWIQFDDREISFSAKELDSLSLAYVTTVHKVQGSEFPAVVIVLHSSHWTLLSRALLYTAITRAKNLVVLVGNKTAIQRAVQNQENFEMNCHLHQRINTELSELQGR